MSTVRVGSNTTSHAVRSASKTTSRKVLHIGCNRKDKTFLPDFYRPFEEIRLDIDPAVSPDILADMRDLSALEDESVDAIFSSHNIEHVFFHEVVPMLKGWHRVLKKGGLLEVRCPDIEAACRSIIEKGAFEILYEAPGGPVTALDILYGFGRSIRRGNEFMAHKCGFTREILETSLQKAGFERGRINNHEKIRELRAIVFKD